MLRSQLRPPGSGSGSALDRSAVAGGHVRASAHRPAAPAIATGTRGSGLVTSPRRVSHRTTTTREEAMQSRPCIIGGIVLVLGAGLALQTATAGPQEDVAAAGQRWATVFADNNPDTITPLYAKDAVLWGTLSPTVRSDPAAVKAYFVGAFQALPKAIVKFGDQLIRVYGNTAVNTGYYTFSFTKDGETKSIPARYSFTYVKDGNDWKIVDDHSSAVPPPPR